jgi:hypothetical protein
MDFAHAGLEAKDIEGLTLLVLALLGGVTVTCLSGRVRDIALFLIMATLVFDNRMCVTFLGKWWYRGSTRGLEVTLQDIMAFSLLVSAVLAPRPGRSRWRWPAGLGLMLLYFLYACGSTLAIEPRVFSIYELLKIARGLVFFVAFALVVRSDRELAICVAGLALATCIEGGMAVRQRLLYNLDRDAGSLDHPNSLSMYLCMVGPVLVAALNSKLPRLVRLLCACAVAAAALTIVLTVSRAGVPTFALVVLAATACSMSWRITLKKVAIVAVVAMGLGLIGFEFWGKLKERFQDSSLAEEYEDLNTVDSRGYYLRLARLMLEDRFFGVGLNNWSYSVSKKYGAMMKTPYADYDAIPEDINDDLELKWYFAAPAHNLAALTAGELGVPGLVIFALVWMRWLQMGASFLWRRKRTTLYLLGIGIFFGTVGVFLQSVTEWIFRQTPIYLTFHALLGVLASMYAVRRQARRRATAPSAASDASANEMALVRAG